MILLTHTHKKQDIMIDVAEDDLYVILHISVGQNSLCFLNYEKILQYCFFIRIQRYE